MYDLIDGGCVARRLSDIQAVSALVNDRNSSVQGVNLLVALVVAGVVYWRGRNGCDGLAGHCLFNILSELIHCQTVFVPDMFWIAVIRSDSLRVAFVVAH